MRMIGSESEEAHIHVVYSLTSPHMSLPLLLVESRKYMSCDQQIDSVLAPSSQLSFTVNFLRFMTYQSYVLALKGEKFRSYQPSLAAS